MWVVPGCLFLQTEMRRYGLPWRLTVAYTATGFLGAISLSFPLFFSHVTFLDCPALMGSAFRTPAPLQGTRVSALQAACAAVAVASVVVLPLTLRKHDTAYVSALAALHVVLAVPAVVELAGLGGGRAGGGARGAFGLRDAYLFLAGACFAVHAGLMAAAVEWIVSSSAAAGGGAMGAGEVLTALVAAGWQNACQSSISFDVVFTTAAVALFLAGRRGWRDGALAAVLSPLLSVGCVFSLFMAAEFGREAAGSATAVKDAGAMAGAVQTTTPTRSRTPARRRRSASRGRRG